MRAMRLPNRAHYLIQRLAFWGGRRWVRLLFACAAFPLMVPFSLGQPLRFSLQVIFLITLLLIVIASFVWLAAFAPRRPRQLPPPLSAAAWLGTWLLFIAGFALILSLAYAFVSVAIPALHAESLVNAARAVVFFWMGLCLLIVGVLLALALAVHIFVPLRALARAGRRRWRDWRFAQISRDWYTQPLLNGTRRNRSEVR